VTSPEQNDPPEPPVDLAKIARELTNEVRGVRTDLAAVHTWRRRFALAATGAGTLFVAVCLVVAYFITQNYQTSQHLTAVQQHLSAVVACTNQRNAAFVAAVNQRSQISTRQSQALEKLFGQVLHITSTGQFTADVNAYIAAANSLAAHPLPAYPANACT
jgi:hypothetical protein